MAQPLESTRPPEDWWRKFWSAIGQNVLAGSIVTANVLLAKAVNTAPGLDAGQILLALFLQFLVMEFAFLPAFGSRRFHDFAIGVAASIVIDYAVLAVASLFGLLHHEGFQVVPFVLAVACPFVAVLWLNVVKEAPASLPQASVNAVRIWTGASAYWAGIILILLGYFETGGWLERSFFIVGGTIFLWGSDVVRSDTAAARKRNKPDPRGPHT